jgi:carboxymethylenebutenolidase
MDYATGTMVSIQAQDAHPLDAYFCPAQASTVGIVIIQEIFGVNAFIKSIAEYWAQQGYQTCAPALFDRVEKNVEVPYAELKKGFEYLEKVMNWEKQLLDIDAAKQYLISQGAKKIAVMGFCWGGTLAWLSACRLSGLSAASCYYGGNIANFKDEKPRCPVLMHYGTEDIYVTSDQVTQIRDAQPQAEIFIYPNAGHGFRCNHRADYQAAAAELADSRTKAFLKQHLA